MYYDYFGLKQPPFKITPDTSLFYPGCNRGAVLEALMYAILNGEGIVKVVGEVGSGKTMLCRMLEKELPDNVEIVYLANPSLSPENILHAIAFELKLPVKPVSSRLQVMNELHEYLLQRHSQNKQVVVFVEEAQGMPIATLEEIRLLSNLETQQNKLLQIVLFGQPELDEMIARPEIRQLKERITYSFQLAPFQADDIREYLNSRLRACGYRAGELFEDQAITEIGKYSKGLVRRINILADKSLLAAYAGNSNTVAKQHAQTAARDSEFVSLPKNRWKMPIIIVPALILIVAVISVIVMKSTSPDSAMPPPLTAVPEQEQVRGETAPVETTTMDTVEQTTSAQEPVLKESTSVAVQERDTTAVTTGPPVAESENISEAHADVEITVANAGEDKEIDVHGNLRRIDLKSMIDWHDPRVFTNLTDTELELLQIQMELLPPEVALLGTPSASGDVCRVCWSMIYRPLQKPENL